MIQKGGDILGGKGTRLDAIKLTAWSWDDPQKKSKLELTIQLTKYVWNRRLAHSITRKYDQVYTGNIVNPENGNKSHILQSTSVTQVE